jgi:hypothetical protein
LFGDLVLAPIFKTVPLEMIVFVLGETLAQFFGIFWFSGLIVLLIGMFLLRYNSYSGVVTFNRSDETIYLSGKISTFINIYETKELMIYPYSILGKHAMRFTIDYDKIFLKFPNKKSLAEFFEWINPTVMKYQSINLINYYVE